MNLREGTLRLSLLSGVLGAVLALPLCVCEVWAQPVKTHSAQTKGINPVLLEKAKAGDAEAQYQLGEIYYSGDGVRRDYSQAEIWFRKAAEQGNADSEFMLGGLHHFGQGAPQDNAQAFAWVMKAAKQGHEDAEFYISTCYSEGWGVPKDDAKGFVWLRKAAEQGHTNSQDMLGWAYESGIGVPQDYSEAYFWLELATAGDLTGSKLTQVVERRDKAAQHLTQAELSSAQARVLKWQKDHTPKPQ